jgi:hypothetical protein
MTTMALKGGKGKGKGHNEGPRDIDVDLSWYVFFSPFFVLFYYENFRLLMMKMTASTGGKGQRYGHDDGPRNVNDVDVSCTLRVFSPLFSFYFTNESFRLLTMTMTMTASTGGKVQGNGHDKSPRDVNVVHVVHVS